jgi:holliday junction DNA helicase RuvA
LAYILIYNKYENYASFFNFELWDIINSMISHILGKAIYKDEKKIILDRSGIGFEIFLASSNLKELRIGEERDVYTFLFLGEKVVELYGFLSIKELELFKTLKSVSGVGPKTAMNLAVIGSLDKLKEVLESGKMPADVKGVGTKKLQKILLEITGKIEEIKKASKGEGNKDEVFDALLSLGFSKRDILAALSQVARDLSQEERIKEALKLLGR